MVPNTDWTNDGLVIMANNKDVMLKHFVLEIMAHILGRVIQSTHDIDIFTWYQMMHRHHPTLKIKASQIAKFMGPTWGPPESCWPQVDPMLAPWTLLSGIYQAEEWSGKMFEIGNNKDVWNIIGRIHEISIDITHWNLTIICIMYYLLMP